MHGSRIQSPKQIQQSLHEDSSLCQPRKRPQHACSSLSLKPICSKRAFTLSSASWELRSIFTGLRKLLCIPPRGLPWHAPAPAPRPSAGSSSIGRPTRSAASCSATQQLPSRGSSLPHLGSREDRVPEGLVLLVDAHLARMSNAQHSGGSTTEGATGKKNRLLCCCCSSSSSPLCRPPGALPPPRRLLRCSRSSAPGHRSFGRSSSKKGSSIEATAKNQEKHQEHSTKHTRLTWTRVCVGFHPPASEIPAAPPAEMGRRCPPRP